MSVQKKSAQNRRTKTSAKRRTSNQQPKKSVQKKRTGNDSRIRREIVFLIVLAFSILLLLGNFELAGWIGQKLSGVFFGLLGFLAYLFPVVFFGTYFYLTVKRGDSHALRRTIGMLCFYFFLCAFFHLIMIGYEEKVRLSDLFFEGVDEKIGGGLLGGSIVCLFGNAFGTIGAYVLVLFALIISAIWMTQEPLLKIIRERSELAYQRARARRKEQQILSEAEKEATPVPEAHNRKIQRDPIRQAAADRILSGKKQTAGVLIDLEELRGIPEEPPAFTHSVSEDTSTAAPDPIPVSGIPLSEVGEPERIGGAVPSEHYDAASKEKKPENPPVISASSVKEKADSKEEIVKEAAAQRSASAEYEFPPLSLLKSAVSSGKGESRSSLQATATKLQQTLHDFGVEVRILNISCGPTVTRYELQPEQGVKVSRILNLQDDIKLNLAATDIRIEAPIPGKSAIGIEVPNTSNQSVMLRELLESDPYQKSKAKLTFAVGKDIGGNPVIADISKMPHVLIAGATGSGKSVCINTLIMSILYKATPDEVKLIMIDPKMVELSVYNGIPHLFIPVVTDPKKAAGALEWAVAEMTDRYNKFAELGVRNLSGYNEKISKLSADRQEEPPRKMSRLVIIVDELADLMMVAQHEVETSIVRLSQLARAAGIHLVIATQRPSVNVITGLIKANMPSRIALAVTSGVDSRTILDMNGAEKLLGRGDMLFFPQNLQKPERVQGAFISDDEIASVVDFLSEHTSQKTESENPDILEKMEAAASGMQTAPDGSAEERDIYFTDAGKLIIDKDKASIGMLQRAFKIGFNRAARIMDQLCEAGIVGEEEGTKPRKVLMTAEQFQLYLEEHAQ